MIPALCTILDIPLDRVLLVVDNAKSPAHAISLENRAYTFRRDIIRQDACRWSNMPPLISSANDDLKNRTMNNTLSLTSIFGDIVHEKKMCTPIRIPIRQQSRDSIFHDRKDNDGLTNVNKRRAPTPTQPARGNHNLVASKCSTTKINEKKHSTRPLRIPIRQESRRRMMEGNERSDFISDNLLQAFTTAEILSKVIEDLDN